MGLIYVTLKPMSHRTPSTAWPVMQSKAIKLRVIQVYQLELFPWCSCSVMMLTLCHTDNKKIILMLYDTDIYDTHVVFITMIQRLMAKYHSQIIIQHIIVLYKSWDQLMSPPTLKIMDEKTHCIDTVYLPGCSYICAAVCGPTSHFHKYFHQDK